TPARKRGATSWCPSPCMKGTPRSEIQESSPVDRLLQTVGAGISNPPATTICSHEKERGSGCSIRRQDRPRGQMRQCSQLKPGREDAGEWTQKGVLLAGKLPGTHDVEVIGCDLHSNQGYRRECTPRVKENSACSVWGRSRAAGAVARSAA